MSKTHVIDGKTYVEVERQAEIGDYVTKDGVLSKVVEVSDCFGGCIDIEPYLDEEDGQIDGWVDGHYKVLESVASEEWPPIELTANDIRWQPDKVIDLLANLARRVSSLEAQLKDTQGNVERQAEEIATLSNDVNERGSDIDDLYERTEVRNIANEISKMIQRRGRL